MSKRNLILTGVLTTSLLGFVAGGAAIAHPRGGWGGEGSAGAAFAEPGMRNWGAWRHVMRRLDLSEQQRDKIFEIRYAQEPTVRDKLKALRKVREALRESATAENYDAQRVHNLADQQARILADLAVMRTETFHRIYGVLTPEQKQKLAGLKEGRRSARD
jgi:Spy/CpxP family protein refolding chaperone